MVYNSDDNILHIDGGLNKKQTNKIEDELKDNIEAKDIKNYVELHKDSNLKLPYRILESIGSRNNIQTQKMALEAHLKYQKPYLVLKYKKRNQNKSKSQDDDTKPKIKM